MSGYRLVLCKSVTVLIRWRFFYFCPVRLTLSYFILGTIRAAPGCKEISCERSDLPDFACV